MGFTSESDFWTPGGVLRVDTESVGGLRAFVAALVSRVAAILSAPALVACTVCAQAEVDVPLKIQWPFTWHKWPWSG